MQTTHFLTEGDSSHDHFEYLAIQGENDSRFKMPIYKKQADGKFHRLDGYFWPSFTKFIPVNVQLHEDLTAEEIQQRFGEISALPW